MDTAIQGHETELNAQLAERFKTLPKIVQDAITSADVQKHLRDLAETQKLHLDQWQLLENEVMLTLLGFQPTDKLKDNIKSEVGVTDEEAAALAEDISKTVFEPIRGELERLLEHPEAKAAEVSDVETARQEALAGQSGESAAQGGTQNAPPAPTLSVAPTVAPATPPAPAPTTTAKRAPVSSAYQSGQPSTARANVQDDPYREPPA
ncbi:MAG: hypothetical protein RLZZ416_341 [Candidatus Parcubacteria bacterium]|jgi:hypothetical protein